MKTIELISWNVNGIRSILQKGFLDFVQTFNPDIICLQEIKALPEQVTMELHHHYLQFWNPALNKKGYSGTAIFSKMPPLAVIHGIGLEEHDQEGRVLTLEFPTFFLVNVYTPNSKTELERLPYRTQIWDVEFLAFLKRLEHSKPVVFGGDLNVAHKEIDIARPKENGRTAGFTREERESFDKILAAGFIDTFRYFNKEPDQYTWWSYRAGARHRNIGWRIDYFCASKSLESQLVAARIYPKIMGSDHCPVALTFNVTSAESNHGSNLA